MLLLSEICILMWIHKKYSIQGFSLLEIIISIMILLILTSVSIPIGRRAVDYTLLKTTGNNIKNAIKLAQSKALADPQLHCGFYLLPTTDPNEAYAGEYGVFYDINGNYLYESDTDTRFMNAHFISKGIEFSIPENGGIQENVVVFRGDGSAKLGGSIVLTSRFERTDSIHVLASTGRVNTIIK